jgi:hypothetical protein
MSGDYNRLLINYYKIRSFILLKIYNGFSYHIFASIMFIILSIEWNLLKQILFIHSFYGTYHSVNVCVYFIYLLYLLFNERTWDLFTISIQYKKNYIMFVENMNRKIVLYLLMCSKYNI